MLILSLLPSAIIFLVLGFTKCINKRNFGRVVKLFFLGILAIIVTLTIDLTVVDFIEGFLDQDSIIYQFIHNLLFVGLIEEGTKYISIRLGTRKALDGYDPMSMIVYSVTAGLAFATIENIFFLQDSSIVLAIARAIFTVPNHAAYGVIMGYCLGLARSAELMEDKASARSYRMKALFIPLLIHAFIDFLLSLNTRYAISVFVAMYLTIVNYVFAVILIEKAVKRRR